MLPVAISSGKHCIKHGFSWGYAQQSAGIPLPPRDYPPDNAFNPRYSGNTIPDAFLGCSLSFNPAINGNTARHFARRQPAIFNPRYVRGIRDTADDFIRSKPSTPAMSREDLKLPQYPAVTPLQPRYARGTPNHPCQFFSQLPSTPLFGEHYSRRIFGLQSLL